MSTFVTRVPEVAWQDYLDARVGFRNHWYPAFFSHELKEADASAGNGAQRATTG